MFWDTNMLFSQKFYYFFEFFKISAFLGIQPVFQEYKKSPPLLAGPFSFSS